MTRHGRPLGWTVLALLLLAPPAFGEVQVAVERNVGAAATPRFSFKTIPGPVPGTAASRAKLAIVRGLAAPASGPLGVLTDGLLPEFADDPRANFFFFPESGGGCFRMDFGGVIGISRVGTFSWHPSTRGPQVYTLYASDGSGRGFDPGGKGAADPVASGWKLLARVDNRLGGLGGGGQYGVSITDSAGSLGDYRYLLFCCEATELADDAGNTFYSEVNVIAKP